MELIELAVKLYAVCLLVRVSVAGSGQLAFNPFYRGIERATDPLLRFLGRILGGAGPRSAAATALVLSVVLLGVLYGPGARGLALFPDLWIFATGSFWWGPARALVALSVFSYQVSAFFLFLECLSPGTANQLTRLSAEAFGPVRRILPRPGPALLVWVAVFGALLALLRTFYAAAGILSPAGASLLRGWLSAVGALLGFAGPVVFLLIARAVLSFFPAAGLRGGMGYLLENLTDPILRPFRALNLRFDRWDLTPAAAVFAVLILRKLAELLLLRLGEALP